MLFAQPNCNYYKYTGDLKRYQACLVAEKSSEYYQFSREFQSILDSAIAIDPKWSYPYREKSTAYLKSGDFVTWKKLIDQAVIYDTLGNLFYRGRNRLNFFRDYKGAIEDFNLLKKLLEGQDQMLVHDDTHVDIYLGLCHGLMGNTKKALSIIASCMAQEDYVPGLLDHFYLGVLYVDQKKYKEAILAFKKQELINDLAENRFYTALAYAKLEDIESCKTYLNKAQEFYRSNRRMHDYYVAKPYKIYWSQIEKFKKSIQGISQTGN